MNELKAKLTSLGLSDEMATKALHAVGEFAKTKLPENMHPLVNQFLGDDSNPSTGSAGGLGGLGDMLGGFFADKK